MAAGNRNSKKANGGIPSRTPSSNEGLHELPSGLLHTADSLSHSPYGQFIDRFGPPGDPARRMAVNEDRPRNFGEQPSLLKGLAGNKRKGLE
jgi:hypothetical protein